MIPDAELARELSEQARHEIDEAVTELGVQRLLDAARLEPDPETARRWRLEALTDLVWGGALTAADQLATDLGDDITAAPDDPRVLYVLGHLAMLHGQQAGAEVAVAAARVDADAVVRSSETLAAMGPDSAVFEPGIVDWCGYRAEALSAIGRAEEGLRLVEAAAERAHARVTRSAMVATCRARGVIAASHGDAGVAADAFAEGESVLESLEMPFLEAQFRFAHGAQLRRAGRRRAAVTRLERALELFRILGARPYAERLVVSVKTVEYHLANVFTKLALRSRAQLVARMTSTTGDNTGESRGGTP